jgi:glycosyltransferase involved in cell wall biosynthesis
MRVAVASVQVPFIRGGGETHAEGLACALRSRGVETELVTMPFRFSPPLEVVNSMNSWGAQDFERLACGKVDRVICLKFPTFYLNHPSKTVWLMHQHRAVYELFNTEFGENDSAADAVLLRDEVVRRDTESLRSVPVFANSRRVSHRLLKYNGVASTPLYHPPPNAERYFDGDQLPYIFAPSRLESLKRHELLLRAMPFVDKPVMAIFVGEGGMRAHLERLVDELDLHDRVRFLGFVSPTDMIALYANCLGVFFGPFDEDYGYVTLEAMLSAKPVITCSDSGGPLEFVSHQESGYVVEPTPEGIATAVNRVASNRGAARDMGLAARLKYASLGISWTRVVDTLLG